MKAAVKQLSRFLGIIENIQFLYVVIKWEVPLNSVSLVKSQNAEPPSFSVIISKQASQVIVAPCKHEDLHMARNAFPACDILIRSKLSKSLEAK